MIPQNEMGVIVLFAQGCVGNPDIEIVSIGSACPDAIVRWKGQEYRVEFEYKSTNFWTHGHNPIDCDLIICWEDDDVCPILPIVALSQEGWIDSEIALTKNVEKSAYYWKRRALEAEIRLNGINKEAYSTTRDEMIKDNLLTATENKKVQDLQFVDMVTNLGVSRRKAALKAYGRAYAGDIVERGQRALGEILQ